MRLGLARLSNLVAIVLVSSAAFALDTADKLAGPVTKFVNQAELQHMTFPADPSKQIGILHWPALGKGTPIVIVPGRGEIGYQWAETAYDLRNMGALGEVYVWDPPGQGLSSRLFPGDPHVGDIAKFSDYTDGLVSFLESINSETGQKPIVLAHSMGGAIALTALEENPELASKLVLVSPMLDIHISKLPFVKAIVNTVADVLYRLNLLQNVVVGRAGPRFPHTSDTDRLAFRKYLLERFDGSVPGKTLRWVAAANRGISSALRSASKIRIPILTFIGGKDRVIDPDGAEMLTKTCAGNCRLITISDSEHAMHEERDEIRGQLLNEIANFLGLGCRAALTNINPLLGPP